MLGLILKGVGGKTYRDANQLKKKKKKERDMNGWTKRRESETKSSIP
jgi:hypothetical protein